MGYSTLNKQSPGFTLIELMIATSIFAIVGASIYGLFDWSIRTLANSKAEIEAITIISHKIEEIRNMPYTQIGTVGGIPAGAIPQTETVAQNNRNYIIKNYVKYYDDPFDGTATTTDTLPTDYKVVQVTASWTNFWGEKSTNLSTIVAPKGMETSAGGGTLTVTVFNANGLPVENANVNITNGISDPLVAIDTFTDSYGRVSFPGSPDSSGYKITVTKSGYSTDRTCSIDQSGNNCSDSEGNPNPTNPDAAVLEEQTTEVSFAIDLLSTVNIKTANQNFPSSSLANLYTEGEQDNPSFTMDSSGNYYFVWRDDRSGQQRIYTQKYNSSYAQQWGDEDLQISASNNQNSPSVAVDNNGYVYIAWVDDRDNGNLSIYLKKFDSSGNAVFNDKKITTQNNSSRQYTPQIAVTGDNNFIYLAWQDDVNDDGDIYLQKINTGDGSNVWAAEKKINSGAGTTLESMPQLKITTDSNYIYVVWQDTRNGNQDIYMQKIDNSGNLITTGQWLDGVLINDDNGTTDQLNPKLEISNNNSNIYIVWQDERADGGDIYLQKFDTEGNKTTDSQWVNGNLLVNQYQNDTQSLPAIAVDSLDDIFVSWTDERNNGDVYLQKFNSGGNKLWAIDAKINSDNSNTTQTNSILAIKPTNNKIIIAWQDDVMGDNNIYAASFLYPIRVNLGNVGFNMQGEKTIGNNPVIYKYNANHTTSGNGDLTLNNIEWDAYNFTVSTSTGLVLSTADMPLPLNVAPNQNANLTLFLKSDTGHSYLAIVKDETQTAIPDAVIRLYNTGESYDQVISADNQGQAFFTSLSQATYTLEVSAGGYVTATSTVAINGEVVGETILYAE